MCPDPIRAVSFHMAATRGIVSHAARAAPYHYLCHGTTPLFSRTSIFDTPVSLCFCDAFSVDAIKRFSTAVNCRCGLEHSSLHSTRTTKVFDVVPRGYNLLHLFSFVLEELQRECHYEWNRAVGIAVKARANNWYLYLDNYAFRLLIKSNNRPTKHNAVLFACQDYNFVWFFNANTRDIFCINYSIKWWYVRFI